MRPCPQGDILPAEPDERGDAQTGLDGDQQQRPIAPPSPRMLIRHREERVDFGARQKGDGCTVLALTRDSQDPLDQATVVRGV